MKKTSHMRYLYLTIYIAGIILIYLSSLQSGDTSANESSWVANFLFKIIDNINFLKIEIDYETFHQIVRKAIGHFGSFFVIGIFGYLSFTSLSSYYSRSVGLSVSIGAIVAITAELFQLLAIERGPLWSDMAINFSGYIISTFICLIIFMINRKRARLS
ncbi:MAG TPA: VanZ family protein [Bacilli bacterium]|nr:VanZ family protein [Bacilli bacterium]